MSDNPFLLPPGGARRTPPAAPTRVPDAAPAASPGHYITVPASVESGTHRISRPTPEPAPAAEPALAAEPAPAAEPASGPPADDTRVAAPRRWALVMPDGARVSLDGPLLLGRNPAGIPDRPDAGPLAVADPHKTVSKTHALLEPTTAGVLVRDLHSTNGVAIATPAGRQNVLQGGEAIAPNGATILLGSFAIEVAAG